MNSSVFFTFEIYMASLSISFYHLFSILQLVIQWQNKCMAIH